MGLKDRVTAALDAGDHTTMGAALAAVEASGFGKFEFGPKLKRLQTEYDAYLLMRGGSGGSGGDARLSGSDGPGDAASEYSEYSEYSEGSAGTGGGAVASTMQELITAAEDAGEGVVALGSDSDSEHYSESGQSAAGSRPGTAGSEGSSGAGAVAVVFAQPGPLGLQFAPYAGGGPVQRVQLRGLAAGTQAEQHPELTAGLLLDSVAGQPVEALPYAVAIAAIKASGRPVELSFCRVPQRAMTMSVGRAGRAVLQSMRSMSALAAAEAAEAEAVAVAVLGSSSSEDEGGPAEEGGSGEEGESSEYYSEYSESEAGDGARAISTPEGMVDQETVLAQLALALKLGHPDKIEAAIKVAEETGLVDGDALDVARGFLAKRKAQSVLWAARRRAAAAEAFLGEKEREKEREKEEEMNKETAFLAMATRLQVGLSLCGRGVHAGPPRPSLLNAAPPPGRRSPGAGRVGRRRGLGSMRWRRRRSR
jgi:hypothetical protein